MSRERGYERESLDFAVQSSLFDILRFIAGHCRQCCAWRLPARHGLALCVLVACWLWCCPSAQAQPPQPLIQAVYPAGGQRGVTFAATVMGTNLQGAVGVHVSGPGVTGTVVTADKPDTIQVSITIAPDAALGERDIRVLTPGGCSNRYRFMVGELPEVNEVEPNTEKAQAQVLAALPVLVNGQLLEPDIDYFRFSATAGQTIVCALQGRSLLPYIPDAVPGWMDACLALDGPDGKPLASIDDYHLGPDPVLIYTIPADGAYTLEVRDVVYRGRWTFIYRLSIGALPHVGSLFPLGGQRNTTAQLELRGVNLPANSLSLPIPPDSPSPRQVGLTDLSPRSNCLPFAVGDAPDAADTEPNDALAQAQRITVPVAINGRLQQPTDNDYFIFAATAGQVLALEVQARRLGSPVDSILYLYNAQGGELGRNDEWVDPVEPLLTHHADSRIVYAFPADGDYVVRIKDIQRNGGDEYAYRLQIVPPRPDFALVINPDNPRLSKGDTALIAVRAIRLDGFGGEIALAAQNLPAGFVAGNAIIPAGQDQTRLALTAPPDATLNIVTPTIIGTADIGGVPAVRVARGVENVTQAFSLQHAVPTQELAVAVIEPVLLTLTTLIAPAAAQEVKQGTDLSVVVKAVRHGGAAGGVTLSLDGAPAWLTMQPAPAAIPAEQSELAVTLSVAKDAPVGQLQNIFITGTLNTGQATATRFAPAVPVKVLPGA
jgi:hypothetical protein